MGHDRTHGDRTCITDACDHIGHGPDGEKRDYDGDHVTDGQEDGKEKRHGSS
jgi:hypothetical protein